MVKASLRPRTNDAVNAAPVVEVQAEVVADKPAPSEDLVAAAAEAGGVSGQQTEPTTAVATRPAQQVSTHRSSPHVEGLEGDWGSDDLKFPQLKIVQGSGELSKQFDNGTIIYADEELLPPPSVKPGAVNTPIRFVPISITKQFREKLNEEQVAEGLMPRIADSVQAVEDLGGTTRWVGSERPDNYWEPSARMILLVELPEGSQHPGFSLELDGKSYAVAVYYAAGGAFRDSAKIIFNTALSSLLVPVLDGAGQPLKDAVGRIKKKVLLWKNFWALNFSKKQVGQFNVWRPTVKLQAKEETSPDVRAYCAQIANGGAEAATQAED